MVRVEPGEQVPGRPFTGEEMTRRDLEILRWTLGDLQSVLSEVDAGIRSVADHQKLAWHVDGLTHRLIICSMDRLRSHEGPYVVGFFGERRTDLDITPLEETNTEIVAEFTKYPGILSYSSVELAGGHWANMVLHSDPIDTEYWRRSPLHTQAVESLSPVHYRNVRIQNARLTGDVRSAVEFELRMTKYYDYSGSSLWSARRPAAG